MTKLILVRHGGTDWERKKRIRGAVDIPLDNEGTIEAQKISGELAKTKIDAIYSSCASCSFSTASEIAKSRNLKVKKIRELKELDLGLWQGLCVTDVKKRYRKQYAAWRNSPTSVQPPKGESAKDAFDRTISALHKIVDRHKDGNVCVVSGSMTLSIMKCYLKNVNIETIWKSLPEQTWWEKLEFER
ncbi:MAG: histidine phosphatase family protein [Omnitrophica bacterium]|nr:histidine phosphatase family protein [Candidatus Omnitrophota bacterium]